MEISKPNFETYTFTFDSEEFEILALMFFSPLSDRLSEAILDNPSYSSLFDAIERVFLENYCQEKFCDPIYSHVKEYLLECKVQRMEKMLSKFCSCPDCPKRAKNGTKQ